MWLNETLKIKYPLIQGGMANIATGAFAAAVSNAGGLGLIAGGGMSPEMLRENIREAKKLTDKPFGVNLMLLHPQADEMADIVVEEKVPVVTTGAGNPGIYINKWKEAGIIVMPVVPSVALAKRMERAGVDAVIAEGTESGGHVGELTTMALVPQVKAAVNIPVIVAGGVASGKQLLAAVALGGVSMNGGRGRIWGTFVGVLIIAVLNNGLNILGVSSYYQDVVKGLVILIAVLSDRKR